MPLQSQRFADRREAGRQLARKLLRLKDQPGVIVLALPRGGVPVAAEIAVALRRPLDVFVVRKLGVPQHPELAMGAVASGGVRVVNPDVLSEFMIARGVLEAVTAEEGKEVTRREVAYRGHKLFPDLRGATVVIVDDGIATGATMTAAVRAIRELHAARVVVAAPVIAASTHAQLLTEADEVVSVESPERFLAVGAWYEDFTQTTDAEVVRLLTASPVQGERPRRATLAGTSQEISIPTPGGILFGDLSVPANAMGLVIFAHGSGSSRLSPRNLAVATELRRHSLATLLFDLLTAEEEALDRVTAELRFQVGQLLAPRLVAVTDWVTGRDDVLGLPIGYFGASTGAAAAIIAAAERPNVVSAVVSRGGRPELAGAALAQLVAPTLLIVGSLDREVLHLNRVARERMTRADSELAVVPGATHLFEEPGTLESVTHLATQWFRGRLVAPHQIQPA